VLPVEIVTPFSLAPLEDEKQFIDAERAKQDAN
jgi:hypothetical protein